MQTAMPQVSTSHDVCLNLHGFIQGSGMYTYTNAQVWTQFGSMRIDYQSSLTTVLCTATMGNSSACHDTMVA